jgi:xanthine dehydrogenase YagS FAD-binding subunit
MADRKESGRSLQSFFLLPAQDLTKENSLQPGEIITHIVLPAPSDGVRSSYRKVRARGSWDFALAGVALALSTRNGRVERGRIVLSGVAPIPWRAIDGEKALIGQKLDAETAARVADASVKGAEPMTQNGYKVDLVRAIVEEAILAMA